MDLGCLDLGCIEKQISQVSLDSDTNPNDSLPSNSKPLKNKVSKQGNQPSPRVLNRLTAQIKKPPRRKTSPLSWFPRKKGDSYLKRKLKLLQEVDGMSSTLDETLSDTNPHFSRVLREKIAVKEAVNKVIEARKAALVEASWCRILRASRIDCKEAEDVLVKAENHATEAFESAKEIGVIMYDIQGCPRKHCKIETSVGNGGESTTHTVTTSFDTAFEVDKQVAAAVKAAFVRLSTCASIGEQEFKKILKKISQNPDLDENCQDICELPSECEPDAGHDFEPKSHKNEIESNKEKQKENLVDMMLQRLKCLHEEELASLATIVATCGLNAALAEAENGSGVANGGGRVSSKDSLPGLDKLLVRRLTRLEREIQDAKSGKTKETLHKDNKITKQSEVVVPDLGSMLTKHTSKLEKEMEEIKKKRGYEYEPVPKGKPSERLKQDKNNNLPSLGEVLIKRVSRLEKEVQEARKEKENVDLNKEKRSKEKVINDDSCVESLDRVLVKHVSRLEKEKLAFGDKEEEVKVNKRDRKLDLEHNEGGLDQILVKQKSRLVKEKVVADVAEPGNQIKNPLAAKREARERELQEAWGGMSFGNSIRPHVSRLQREKAAWIKAGEAERRSTEESRVV